MVRGSVPFHAWMVLAAAVVAVSSAGAVLQSIDNVPPLLRMSWRLQATSLVLFPFAIVQWNKMDEYIRSNILLPRNLMIILASGVCLFLHFGTWGWSLVNTSLTHSLLFVTAHPLIIVFGMALIAKYFVNYRSPSRWEIIGACIADEQKRQMEELSKEE